MSSRADPDPAFAFQPEPDRSCLVFCPEHGGWHVWEWWEIDGPGRRLLAWDVSVELLVSHVLDVPADAMDTSRPALAMAPGSLTHGYGDL